MDSVTSRDLPARPLAVPNLLTYARIAAVPAVVGDEKPLTTTVLAAAGLTVMPFWLPVMLLVTVSAAVMLSKELAEIRNGLFAI